MYSATPEIYTYLHPLPLHDALPIQLVDRHVAADRDMADEADIVGERRAFVAARDRLDRLVVGGDAGADQTIGHGQPVDDIDRDIVRFLQCFGGVIARGPRPDDRDMTHQPTPSGIRAGARDRKSTRL